MAKKATRRMTLELTADIAAAIQELSGAAKVAAAKTDTKAPTIGAIASEIFRAGLQQMKASAKPPRKRSRQPSA